VKLEDKRIALIREAADVFYAEMQRIRKEYDEKVRQAKELKED